jgi:hypothetical protein
VTADEVERGQHSLVSDAAWAALVGSLFGGVVLTGFAVALGASPMVIGVLAAIPFSSSPGLGLGWVLPSLGLGAITIAATTWRDPVPVAVGLAATWVAAVLVLTVGDGRSTASITNGIAVRAPMMQVVSLAVIAVGVAIAASRRAAFEQARFS